jgi:hypothetical protein
MIYVYHILNLLYSASIIIINALLETVKQNLHIHVYLQLFGRSNDNKGCDQLRCKCETTLPKFEILNLKIAVE